MELLLFYRAIWRRRLRLGVGLLIAGFVLVGLGGTKLSATTVGYASTQVALETPKSQAVDAFPGGANTLAWRASLLSHLMATQASTAAVARRLGVRPAEVTVVDSELAQPVVPTDTATAATKESAADVFTPYVLT